jgi:hypothetical protein
VDKRNEDSDDNEMTTAIFGSLAGVLMILAVWGAFSFTNHVLFGEMTSSQFFEYFPSHVKLVWLDLYHRFEGTFSRIFS